MPSITPLDNWGNQWEVVWYMSNICWYDNLSCSAENANENPDGKDEAGIFKAPDCQDKLNIFCFFHLHLCFSNFLKNFRKRCVCHVQGESIQGFIRWYLISFDSINLIVKGVDCSFECFLVVFVIECRFSTNKSVVYFKGLALMKNSVGYFFRYVGIYSKGVWFYVVYSVFFQVFNNVVVYSFSQAILFVGSENIEVRSDGFLVWVDGSFIKKLISWSFS